MDYLLKSSAIIALFYISYRLFLQRETFFESNRWYLLVGLITAALLPTVVIPIYIEYTPITSTETLYFSEATPIAIETKTFDWLNLIAYIYIMGLIFFSGKLMIEMLSLKRLIENNPKIKMERFSLIEIIDKIAPFSFFNWIVYNPTQFKKRELKLIINHEKVHAKEHHTIDVLIAQICCVLFWFNPLVWLYKKELQQNLEYIADQKAQSVSENKEDYQKLLLKASMPNQQLALSNNFYNSLIKKRIIMLHKSKSKKQKTWKYALIIPALALFLMSFNTKEIFIAKTTETRTILEKEFVINPTSSDVDLETITNYFKNKPVKVQFTEIVRNANNTIKSITLKTKYADGADYTKRMTVSKGNKQEIMPFKISFDPKQDDITLNILEDDLNQQHKVVIGQNETVGNIAMSKTDNNSKEDETLGENPLYVIGNKQYRKENLPNDKIITKGSVEILNKKEGKKQFGKPGKDGAIILNKNNRSYPKSSKVVQPSTTPQANSTRIVDKITVTIYKDYTEADLNLAKAKLEKEGLKVKFRNVKRNNSGEIIAIKIDANSENSKANYNLNGDEAINPISISFDSDSDKISIGNGNSHRAHAHSLRGSVARDRASRARARARTRSNSYIISSSGHNSQNCRNSCDHDHDVVYEFHNDYGENDDVVIKTGKAYVIKNSNTNNGKRIVTITNDDGEEEIVELESDNNTYKMLKSSNVSKGIISTSFETKPGTTTTWVSDDDGKVEYKFLNKEKAPLFLIATENSEKPYILLDGKEISHMEMTELDSGTINSVNVIKGDDATSKYGNKAKNGVIIISTKE